MKYNIMNPHSSRFDSIPYVSFQFEQKREAVEEIWWREREPEKMNVARHRENEQDFPVSASGEAAAQNILHSP